MKLSMISPYQELRVHRYSQRQAAKRKELKNLRKRGKVILVETTATEFIYKKYCRWL
ncbi:hypothetical protein KNV05_gp191 [Vibrio phage River4]|uniref:Uncharacterized protein n=1 Tax=Vibrio phage River4 TaxID=2736288 RepID=A0A6M9Z201_9CAUD|nr:hypothetical protein KNV05_gp191 [Vibrio phage River4]QKN84764.1 hypothetical protein RIVER4_118 [Vibrio phage River4]